MPTDISHLAFRPTRPAKESEEPAKTKSNDISHLAFRPSLPVVDVAGEPEQITPPEVNPLRHAAGAVSSFVQDAGRAMLPTLPKTPAEIVQAAAAPLKGPAQEIQKLGIDKRAEALSTGLWHGLIGVNSKTAGGAAMGIGVLTDNPELVDLGGKMSRFGKDAMDAFKPRVGSIRDVRGPADFADYGAASLGSGVGTSAASLLAGGLMTLGTVNPLFGFAVGAAGPSYLQSFGDVYGSAIEDPAIAAKLREGTLSRKKVAGVAAAVAVPIAAMDVASLETTLGKTLFAKAKKDIVKRLLTGAAVGASTEGATETWQNNVSQWAQDYLGSQKGLKERFFEAVDNLMGGVFSGGAMGGAGSAVSRPGSPVAADLGGPSGPSGPPPSGSRPAGGPGGPAARPEFQAALAEIRDKMAQTEKSEPVDISDLAVKPEEKAAPVDISDLAVQPVERTETPVLEAPAADVTEVPKEDETVTPAPAPIQTDAVAEPEAIKKKPSEMTLPEMEKAEIDPWQVTQKQWVKIQREERARMGQDQDSGTQFAPNVDYEEYHKQSVKEAVAENKPVPAEVLTDYPDLKPSPEPETPAQPATQPATPPEQAGKTPVTPLKETESGQLGEGIKRVEEQTMDEISVLAQSRLEGGQPPQQKQQNPVSRPVSKTERDTDQPDIFPSLRGPSASSISQHPDYVNLTRDANTVVRKHAKERGVEPTHEFAMKLWGELHEAPRSFLYAKPEEKARLRNEFDEKYPDYQAEWISLNSKVAMASGGVSGVITAGEREQEYFEKHIQGRPETLRPKDSESKEKPQEKPRSFRLTKAIKNRANVIRQADIEQYKVDLGLFKTWRGVIGRGIKPPRFIAGSPDIMGEYNQPPLWQKNGNGRLLEDVIEDAMAAKLITNEKKIFDALKRVQVPSRPMSIESYYEAAAREIEHEKEADTVEDTSFNFGSNVGKGYAPPPGEQGDLFTAPKENINDRFQRFVEDAKSAGLNDRQSMDYAKDRLARESAAKKPSAEKTVQRDLGASGGVEGFGRGKKGETDMFSGGGSGRAFAMPESESSEDSPSSPPTAVPRGQIPIEPSEQPVIEMPEIVEIAQELMDGKYPTIRKRLRLFGGNALGVFYPGKGTIELKADIFKDMKLAANVLAHEVGHLVDWLPDQIMERGNVLGRIASLKKHMKSMIERMPGSAKDLPLAPGHKAGAITEGERRKFRNDVTANILKARGIKFADYIKDKKVREMLKQEINDAYAKKIANVIKKRDLLTQKEIREELYSLSKAWRPFDESKAGSEFLKYRKSADELYADAVSVLFNNPGFLQKMAPKFYDAWFNYLERKPEVKAAYEGVVGTIKGGKVVEHRLERTEGMFAKGEEAFKEQIAEQNKEPTRTVLDEMMEGLFMTGIENAVRKANAAGRTVSPEDNPRYALEESRYVNAEVMAYALEVDKIYKDLKTAGVSWEDFGIVMLDDRVMGDRSNLANPQGRTPDSAAKEQAEIEKRLGPEKWKVLRAAIERFRDNRNYLIKLIEDNDFVSPEVLKKLKENRTYVTFEIIEKGLAEGHGVGISSHIFRQIGTLKEIHNVASATLLKDISIIKAVRRKVYAQQTVDYLREIFPESVQPAKTKWNGKFQEAQEPAPDSDLGMIAYPHKGKVEAFWVDKAIADDFKHDYAKTGRLMALWRASNSVFRGLFVVFNPGFQAVNTFRDFWATVTNTKGVSFWKTLFSYKEAMGQAWGFAGGMPDELVQEMLRRKILITPNNRWGESKADSEIEEIVNKYSDTPVKMDGTLMSKFKGMLAVVRRIGATLEATSKIIGFKHLKKNQDKLGLSDREVDHDVRFEVGSPPFLMGGKWKHVLGNIWLFANPFLQGARRSAEVAKDRPVEYHWNIVKYNIAPKAIMLLAFMGVFGDEIRRLMKKFSEYKLSNYLVIPLWTDKNGNGVGLPIPQDDTGRIYGGLFWKLTAPLRKKRINIKNMSDLFAYAAGQTPSLTPLIGATIDLVQYLQGQNPYDEYRGEKVIPERVFDAGGARSHVAMAKYLANSMGAGVVHRFNTQDIEGAKTTLQKIIGLPVVGNILGRFVMVTRAGEAEEYRGLGKEARKDRANRIMDERDAMIDNINAVDKPGREEAANLYVRMVKAGELKRGLSIQPAGEFIKTYLRLAEKKTGDPAINALIYAQTNEEKAAILKHLKDDLSEDEFKRVKTAALTEGFLGAEALVLSGLKQEEKSGP